MVVYKEMKEVRLILSLVGKTNSEKYKTVPYNIYGYNISDVISGTEELHTSGKLKNLIEECLHSW